MGSEVHLYTAGVDPYVLRMGEVTLFIHQGQPSVSTAPVTPPAGPIDIYRPKRVKAPYENYIIAPRDAEDVGLILEAQDSDSIDLGVALHRDESSGTAAGDELQAVLEGLARYGPGDVTVHMVSVDAVSRRDFDG